jgi:hypothetical protein
MKFQKLHDAGVEMAFMANESRDRTKELQESVHIKLFAHLSRYDRRVDTCNILGLPFEAQDYNNIADEEFYVLAATLEAEKARFDSLCQSAATTLTAAFAYESVPGSFPTGQVLAA